MIIVIVMLANINLSSLFATEINYSLKTSLSLPWHWFENFQILQFFNNLV